MVEKIRHADHHTDVGADLLWSLIAWSVDGCGIARQALPEAAGALAKRLKAQSQLHFSDELLNVAILESEQSHCLFELLWRVKSGELAMQVLSSGFLKRFPDLINIHHSFLPAFKSVQPYHRAWE